MHISRFQEIIRYDHILTVFCVMLYARFLIIVIKTIVRIEKTNKLKSTASVASVGIFKLLSFWRKYDQIGSVILCFLFIEVKCRWTSFHRCRIPCRQVFVAWTWVNGAGLPSSMISMSLQESLWNCYVYLKLRWSGILAKKYALFFEIIKRTMIIVDRIFESIYGAYFDSIR